MLPAGFCLLLIPIFGPAKCHSTVPPIYTIPDEVVKITMGHIGPADLVTLGITTKPFQRLIAPLVTKNWRIEGDEPKLSLIKVYRAWLAAKSQAEKDSFEFLLATNLDFIQYYDSLMLFKPFNAAKIYHRHFRQHRFSDVPDVANMGFEWWIRNCAFLIKPNLLRLVLLHANGVRLTEKVVSQAIDAGMQDSSIICLIDCLAGTPFFYYAALDAVFRNKCSIETRCTILRHYVNFKFCPENLLRRLGQPNLDYKHIRMLLDVLPINTRKSLSCGILWTFSQYEDTCLLALLKKFPRSTIPVDLWRKMFNKHTAPKVCLELANYTSPEMRFIGAVYFATIEPLPEDQFLNIISRLQLPIPSEHLFHAISRKFDPIVLKFVASKTFPSCHGLLGKVEALCDAEGCPEALSEEIVSLLRQNFLLSINFGAEGKPKVLDTLVFCSMKLSEVEYLHAISNLAHPLDCYTLKHTLRMRYDPVCVLFVLWHCTVLSKLDTKDIGQVACENGYEPAFIQKIQLFIIAINTVTI